jgi:hypothetical protein
MPSSRLLRHFSLPLSLLLLLAVAFAGVAGLGCTSWRLARLDAYPMGEPLRGPQGGYALVPSSEAWVRTPENEGASVDLALARQSNDAWLNVSVVRGRLPTAALALETARARADALMTTASRQERDLVVPSPEGDLPARMGVYCGTFDREMRAHDNCFVMLAAVRGEAAYVLVGQVRIRDPESGRLDELERLVASLRLVEPEVSP